VYSSIASLRRREPNNITRGHPYVGWPLPTH